MAPSPLRSRLRMLVAALSGLAIIAGTAALADALGGSVAVADTRVAEPRGPVAVSNDPAASSGTTPAVAPALLAATTDVTAVAHAPRPVTLRVASVTPSGPGPYGVGMPVVVRFDRDVPQDSRAAVVAAADVDTPTDIGPAAWSWPADDTLTFRPQHFWPAGTDVDVTLDLAGRPLGAATDRRPLVGAGRERVSFAIGRAQVIDVDLSTQYATVRRGGDVVRVLPVSTGGPGFETRQGIKVVMGTEYDKVFTGEAFGEDYELVASHALRLTDTGEYLHSAPWAAGRLGAARGSHGCTNLSDADAAWLAETSLVGDPVRFVGDDTAPVTEPWNGLGGVWNIPWREWVGTPAV